MGIRWRHVLYLKPFWFLLFHFGLVFLSSRQNWKKYVLVRDFLFCFVLHSRFKQITVDICNHKFSCFFFVIRLFSVVFFLHLRTFHKIRFKNAIEHKITRNPDDFDAIVLWLWLLLSLEIELQCRWVTYVLCTTMKMKTICKSRDMFLFQRYFYDFCHQIVAKVWFKEQNREREANENVLRINVTSMEESFVWMWVRMPRNTCSRWKGNWKSIFHHNSSIFLA